MRQNLKRLLWRLNDITDVKFLGQCLIFHFIAPEFWKGHNNCKKQTFLHCEIKFTYKYWRWFPLKIPNGKHTILLHFWFHLQSFWKFFLLAASTPPLTVTHQVRQPGCWDRPNPHLSSFRSPWKFLSMERLYSSWLKPCLTISEFCLPLWSTFWPILQALVLNICRQFCGI